MIFQLQILINSNQRWRKAYFLGNQLSKLVYSYIMCEYLIQQSILILFGYMSRTSQVLIVSLCVLSLVSAFTLEESQIISLQQLDQASSSQNHHEQLKDFDCGYSTHFQGFLNIFGYANYSFDRPDLKCGAFGGKFDEKDTISRTPVILIHGAGDIGYGRGTTDGYQSWQTGWRSLVEYLASQGYKKSQIYITSWGNGNGDNIQILSTNWHSKAFVTRIRAFIQAVLEYTNAPRVNIIAHSMGVGLARKAIKGGSAHDHTAGNYNIGNSIRDNIHTFIGIAGMNLGLGPCLAQPQFIYCNSDDGFWPGLTPVNNPSNFLTNINSMPSNEGQNVYSVWSKFDDYIQNQCVVWGKITCRIPGQSGQIEKTTSEWKHYTLRDRIGPDIIRWL